MPATTVSASPQPKAGSIPVRTITNADADSALREGWGDFMDMRGDLIFVGLIYVLVGVVAATAIMGGPLLALLFPIIAGIGLLGPVAALGFYEMARRRESGLQSNWQHFLDVRKRPSADDIAIVAALLVAIFVAWIFVASGLYLALFGWWDPPSIGAFLTRVFTTPEGWALTTDGKRLIMDDGTAQLRLANTSRVAFCRKPWTTFWHCSAGIQGRSRKSSHSPSSRRKSKASRPSTFWPRRGGGSTPPRRRS